MALWFWHAPGDAPGPSGVVGSAEDLGVQCEALHDVPRESAAAGPSALVCACGATDGYPSWTQAVLGHSPSTGASLPHATVSLAIAIHGRSSRSFPALRHANRG